MSSLSPKDRVSLCLFTFTDGRRCRTPRTARHPHFCFYHAQKEARAQAAEKLGKDLAYFFSGDYLSACDLSTALARLIPAAVRGDIKPKLARTVAYMIQTLMQTIHISQDEYINAFGSDGWRRAVRHSVNSNRDYLFPPDPQAEQPAPPAPPQTQTQQQAATAAPALQPRPTPAPAPQSTTPHTVASSTQTSSPANQTVIANVQPSAPNSAPAESVEPTVNLNLPAHAPLPASLTAQATPANAALSVARSLFRRRPKGVPTNPFGTNIYTPPRNC